MVRRAAEPGAPRCRTDEPETVLRGRKARTDRNPKAHGSMNKSNHFVRAAEMVRRPALRPARRQEAAPVVRERRPASPS